MEMAITATFEDLEINLQIFMENHTTDFKFQINLLHAKFCVNYSIEHP